MMDFNASRFQSYFRIFFKKRRKNKVNQLKISLIKLIVKSFYCDLSIFERDLTLQNPIGV